MVSNGFLPSWLEANETWPGVCQSCVITTLANSLAILLITGMTWSPPFTARLPPGRKQFCTSMTSSADASSILIEAAAQADLAAMVMTAIVPRPATNCLRSSMSHLPLAFERSRLQQIRSADHRKGACRRGRRPTGLGRLNTVAHGPKSRERLGPLLARRTADDSQRAL